ncbi:uncharacterized protein LOC103367534 [Stegastes partitus]|uniref:Uncharacterized LOC103367534 n=1 Tax=Stegastes partitus TaxID=144197 RepID=A0A3B5AY87_9TELE|nr:PREDICTED: uncharacterized protein LOC103367534 [Stegastes partitus]
MLSPATVSAAAAAVWLLAMLGPGLSLPAEDNSEPNFTLCSDCFYRQTPPQGASAGSLLRPMCHRLSGGQAFATLSRPTCDMAVYSAFHLSHGWTEWEGEEGEELVTEKEEDFIKVSVPSLLRRGGDPSHPVSPADFPLQHWDSTVTTLVQSSIAPQCTTLGGHLFILTGAGGFRAAEDGDKECQIKPLWSAVCCAVPEGKDNFIVGLISETGEGERQVPVKELEEMLGVTDLFFEGCGGGKEEAVGISVGIHSEGLPVNTEKIETDATGEEADDTSLDSGTADQDASPDVEEPREASITQEQVAAGDDAQSEKTDWALGAGDDTQSEKTDDADATRETSADAMTSESSSNKQQDVTHSETVRSESPESLGNYESVDEQETDTNSTSTLMYILSTTLSILKAPLHPVVSTVTQLPGQVTYVLEKDLGVLSALPGETFAFFHLLTSDLLSWMRSASEMLLSIGETCFFSVYNCASAMLEALLCSCHTGVTGMGTLAGDTVGIFSDVFDNAWWVTKFFGGRLWEQSEGYVGTVASEMGGQVQAVGGGLGRLAWRSGSGVGNVFRTVAGVILGVINVVNAAIGEAFGMNEE